MGKAFSDYNFRRYGDSVHGARPCHLKDPPKPLEGLHESHEVDGSAGYSDGLRSEQIPLLGGNSPDGRQLRRLDQRVRLSPLYLPERALELLAEETEQGWRDQRIFQRFAKLHREVISKMDLLRRE
jgi:hypothetical protein